MGWFIKYISIHIYVYPYRSGIFFNDKKVSLNFIVSLSNIVNTRTSFNRDLYQCLSARKPNFLYWLLRKFDLTKTSTLVIYQVSALFLSFSPLLIWLKWIFWATLGYYGAKAEMLFVPNYFRSCGIRNYSSFFEFEH